MNSVEPTKRKFVANFEIFQRAVKLMGADGGWHKRSGEFTVEVSD